MPDPDPTISIESNDQRLGNTIDNRYLLSFVLGQGAYGTVYQAHDQFLDRLVAVKILTRLSESSLARFQRECKALATLKCDAIPQIHSWGNDEIGFPYIAMELMQGTTLESHLKSHKVAPEVLTDIFCQIADTLALVHSQGLVHRDLKPENIMLVTAEDGFEAKILDFGIAHLLDSDSAITGTTEMLGTNHYLSPEHFTPKLLDGRSDLFSLGCIMYRCLSGKPPYDAESPAVNVMRMQKGEHAKLSWTIPAYLRYCTGKCLEALPENRFQTALELKEALITETSLLPPEKSVRSRTIAIIFACAITVAITVPIVANLVGQRTKEQAETVQFAAAETSQLKVTPQTLYEKLIAIRQHEPPDTGAQRRVLEEIATAAERPHFWDLATWAFAKELNICGTDQLRVADTVTAELAFSLADKITNLTNSEHLEIMSTRLTQLMNRTDSNILPEVDKYLQFARDKEQRLWIGRFLSLRGSALLHMKRFTEARDSYQEALDYSEKNLQGVEAERTFSFTALNYLRALSAIGDPKSYAKRVQLLNYICDTLPDEGLPKLHFSAAAQLKDCAILLLPDHVDKQTIDKVIKLLSRRAERADAHDYSEYLALAASLAILSNDDEKAIELYDQALASAQRGRLGKTYQKHMHHFEQFLIKAKRNDKLLQLREASFNLCQTLPGWQNKEQAQFYLCFQIARTYHPMKTQDSSKRTREWIVRLLNCGWLSTPTDQIHMQSAASILQSCTRISLAMNDYALASKCVQEFDKKFGTQGTDPVMEGYYKSINSSRSLLLEASRSHQETKAPTRASKAE